MWFYERWFYESAGLLLQHAQCACMQAPHTFHVKAQSSSSVISLRMLSL